MTEEKKCPLYKKCGGCQLQNLSYAEQLGFKQRKTERLLGEFGRVEPIIGMDEPYHYRNKVQAAFGRTKSGKIISGVYQSGTHRIVSVDDCMTEDSIADRIIVDIRNMLRICGGDPAGKMHRLLDYTDRPSDVADPWYTGDFEATWQDVLAGCQGLLREITGHHHTRE